MVLIMPWFPSWRPGTSLPTNGRAQRSDVAVRTVFRHFSDMDTLFATMNQRLTDEVEMLFVDEVQACHPCTGRFTQSFGRID
jgi:AcrR family transcriptional regulator